MTESSGERCWFVSGLVEADGWVSVWFVAGILSALCVGAGGLFERWKINRYALTLVLPSRLRQHGVGLSSVSKRVAAAVKSRRVSLGMEPALPRRCG
ncbi:uncharacterized protein M421DRAFT_417171 [Didymella exigua CBS 183.55]|uniref:Uncharacterized protein n=1 Tax=Didymella exigua CBS 183.55 TaxID=1150837 RepID=A0A6A5RVF7_9PLEO|nr:uncharacterized protein M421DRAFT_417171 [Didymella exigua CBS 183.55]KAF1932455.1 hypothetical protein M421DRAFT_417171 [Didymella exigua CBS 183.55]